MSAITAFRLVLTEAATGAATGAQVTAVYSWRHTSRLDRIGEFTATCAGTDPGLAACTAGRTVTAWATIDGVDRALAAGVIDAVAYSWNGPEMIATISGPDLLGEWSYAAIGRPEAPVVLNNQSILAFDQLRPAPSSWLVTVPLIDNVRALASVGAKRWEYARQLADLINCHIVPPVADRVLTVAPAPVPSGLSLGPGQIGALVRTVTAGERLNAVHPYGAGAAGQVFVPAAGRLPAGADPAITYSAGTNTLTNAAMPGPMRTAIYTANVFPLTASDADLQIAADQVLAAAYRELVRSGDDLITYSLTLIDVTARVRPFQTVRVDYSDPLTGITVAADLIVLEVQEQIDTSGIVTARLTVANLAAWPQEGAAAVAQSLGAARAATISPILNANVYGLTYDKHLQTGQAAAFRFRLDDEITQIAAVRFDFELLPLESTVTGATAQTTAAAAARHYHPFHLPDHVHDSAAHAHTILPQGVTMPAHAHDLRLEQKAQAVANPVGADTDANGWHLYVNSGTTLTRTMRTQSGYVGGLLTIPQYGTELDGPRIGGPPKTNTGGAVPTQSTDADIGVGTNEAGHTHAYDLTLSWGVYRDAQANVPSLADLEYSINGASWTALTAAVDLGAGVYRLDLTAAVTRSGLASPKQRANILQIRCKAGTAATKRANIEAQLTIRSIIQAAYYSG